MRPPMRGRASSTTTSNPARASARAAIRPAAPAPRTATSCRFTAASLPGERAAYAVEHGLQLVAERQHLAHVLLLLVDRVRIRNEARRGGNLESTVLRFDDLELQLPALGALDGPARGCNLFGGGRPLPAHAQLLVVARHLSVAGARCLAGQ